MTDSVTHLTAQPVLLCGRWNRQRCAWCGVLIVDEDLSTMGSTDPNFQGTEWKPQSLVNVTSGNPAISSRVAPTGGKMPENSCMALFVDAAEAVEAQVNTSVAPPVLRVVPP